MAMLNNQRVVWNSNLPLTQNFLRWFSKSSHNRNNDQTMHDRNIILPKLSLADLYIHLYIYKCIPVFPWIVSEPPVTLDYTHQFISRYHMYLHQSQQYIYIHYINYIYKYKSKYEYKYIYEAIYIYRYIYYTVSHGSIPGAISPQVLRLLQVLYLLHLSHDLEALVLVDRGIYIHIDMIWYEKLMIYLYIYIYILLMYDICFFWCNLCNYDIYIYR